MEELNKVGIVGLGLIGGSIAKDLSKLGYEIKGYDESSAHQQKALDLKLVSECLELDDLAKSSDILIVAIPVKLTGSVIRNILDKISWHSVILDTGSTKKNICEEVRSHTKRGRFVACHPLAGTEFSGPQAAISNLFSGKKNIICQEHLSDDDALEVAIDIMGKLQMQSIFMDPKEHDKHMAYVSHLSHVSAFTLGTTVLNIEKDQKQIFKSCKYRF